jgi:hypothetical protein
MQLRSTDSRHHFLLLLLLLSRVPGHQLAEPLARPLPWPAAGCSCCWRTAGTRQRLLLLLLLLLALLL